MWLFACAFTVFLMVAIGGLTRLTESGLSIVKWQPVHGAVPPMNAQEWNDEFDAYKQTPEYIKKNAGMELPEFKKIFWWEFVHRLVGRLVGVIFLIPFIYFAARKRFTKRKGAQLLGIFALGGLQGFIGWWMVSSGLVNNPAVSHFRLATHLSLALIIFSIMLWQGLGFYLLDLQGKKPRNKKARVIANHILIFVFIQIIFGAFMAGLHAGWTYNTWPLMDFKFVPAGIKFSLYNIEFIQFFHRWWAFMVMFFALYFFFSLLGGRIKYDDGVTDKRLKKASHILVALVAIQIILGISTLLFVVPIPLASAHQIMAVLILATAVYIRRVIA